MIFLRCHVRKNAVRTNYVNLSAYVTFQPVERGRNLKRPHFLSNANTALQFLQSKKVSIRHTARRAVQ